MQATRQIEPIRRPLDLKNRNPRRNKHTAQLLRILESLCGKPWSEIKDLIRQHPHLDPSTRPLIAEQLDTFVCRENVAAEGFHRFRVVNGTLELIPKQAKPRKQKKVAHDQEQLRRHGPRETSSQPTAA